MIAVAKTNAIDLDSARDKYLRHARRRGLSPASLTSYQRHIDRFTAFLRQRGRQTVQDIHPKDLVAFEKHLAQNDFAAVTCSQSRSIVGKWLLFKHPDLAEMRRINKEEDKKRWNKEPDLYGPYFYDAVRLFAAGRVRRDPDDRRRVEIVPGVEG